MRRRDFSISTANQAAIPGFVHNIPANIPANGSVISSLIIISGYSKISAGLTSSQAGTMTIQRFLDDAGTVAIGAPESVALTAGVPASLTIADDNIFSSFQITITNTANSGALLTNLGVAVATVVETSPGAGSGSYQNATQTVVTAPTTEGGGILFVLNPAAKYRAITLPRSATDTVWLSLGATAAVDAGFKDMQPGDTYEMTVAQGNLNQGIISAIAENAAQQMLLVEGV